MTDFAVLLAGDIAATARLKARLAGCRVIAADAGIGHAEELGVLPELWLGDFDSSKQPPRAGCEIEIAAYPADKDKTDGELAIEAAIARGATRILLVGALGGPRSDHAFAHYILALRHAGAGIAIELDDGRERCWPLTPGRTLDADLCAGTQFSILKFSDVTGLTITGARYPLDKVAVPFTSILTQSNEATGPISVRIETGHAILMAQADPDRH
ncbi:thiamine diphosphokinase [Fulvimarina sp. 2208YS6-2-32]|uniref:Thiamine diphosphokinase n=1 Tax=Fulvimarina uroteuthidis TaxID=3098149 RepID=A0ABU5I878_9HYPH|nr:thiamine diphosphokinase [Fulvimarina sp. 2208YS6-2-32]MDY8111023.1 thiamine diphosphokinase [Fulvimarina sp. 2208YS6-2-32]